MYGNLTYLPWGSFSPGAGAWPDGPISPSAVGSSHRAGGLSPRSTGNWNQSTNFKLVYTQHPTRWIEKETLLAIARYWLAQGINWLIE